MPVENVNAGEHYITIFTEDVIKTLYGKTEDENQDAVRGKPIISIPMVETRHPTVKYFVGIVTKEHCDVLLQRELPEVTGY